MQRYRPAHGVDHRRARPPRLQQVRLQPEIPLRRPVRIVYQHQPRIVLQSLGLQDHRLLVLPQKLLRKNPENPNRQKQVPGRHKINPAKIAPHRRNGRPAGKPQLPAPNLFSPDIRQNKIDRCRHGLARISLQHPVRRAIRAGRVRTHPKSIRNRLKLLLFFVNAMPAPPIPRLMHKRPMRRIHQTNNSLVDVRRQLAGQVRGPIFPAENSQLRRRRNVLTQSRTGRIHVHPEISIALFARIVPSKDALHFQFVLASQRRNSHAAPAARLKFPPVITALERFPVKLSVRKWYPPVRTRIAHRKRFTVGRAPQNQRHFEQHRGRKFVARNFRASERRIPEIPQKPSITFTGGFPRRLAVCCQQSSYRFTHVCESIVVHRVAREQPANAAAAQQQRHAWRIKATLPSIQLRDSAFSGILIYEHFDVRRFLLADPASLAFVASSLFSSLLTTHHFTIRFSQRICHGRDDVVRQIGSARYSL